MQLWRCPVMWCTVWKGTAQDCIDHMRRTHKVPLSVKAANLAKYFPAWTVTRDQWADMLMPCINLQSEIDTLLFTRVGSPLCHRYRLIIEESDSAVGRRLHRRLAQDLAAHVVKSTDKWASSISGWSQDRVSATMAVSPQRSCKFGWGRSLVNAPWRRCLPSRR